MIVQLNERKLADLGFDPIAIVALRHLLRVAGDRVGAQTLPETVLELATQGMDSPAAVVTELRKEVESLRIQLESLAHVAELGKRLDALQEQFDALPAPAAVAPDFTLDDAFPPLPADWERPGPIGARKSNTVAATSLTTTGAFNLYNGLLKSDGSTGLQFKGAAGLANADAYIENSDTAFLLHGSSSGAISKTIGFCASGAATQQFAVNTTGTATNGTSTVTGGFGCNGKSAQAAYSVGAAATDPATTQTLANNIRLALIANGIAS